MPALNIRVRKLATLTPEEAYNFKRRAQANIEEVLPRVTEMVANVRDHGDAGLLPYVKEFDFGKAKFGGLQVTPKEFGAALKSLKPEVKEAIDAAYANIRSFHEKQMPEPMWFAELQPGVFAGEKISAVGRVACYVPGGKGYFPSVML